MSEFNFAINNATMQNGLYKTNKHLDFRPYGKVLGVDISREELELLEHLEAANITEVPKMYDYIYVGGFDLISIQIPIGDIQKIIRSEINRLVPEFNKLAQEEKKKNDDEIPRVGFSRVPERTNLIEYVHYKNINPFEWKVQLVHRNPAQQPGMRDEVYQYILRDKGLYLNMVVSVYYTEKEGGKVFHIRVSRMSGRSPAIWDFYRNLKYALDRAEKIHNLFNKKR